MNELLELLSTHNLMDDSGNIVLERYPNGGYQAVDAESFTSIFGSAIEGVEQSEWYAALIAADQGRGYSRFFDTWKNAGIL